MDLMPKHLLKSSYDMKLDWTYLAKQLSAIQRLWIITSAWHVGQDGVIRKLKLKKQRFVQYGRNNILRKRISTLFVSATSVITVLDLKTLFVLLEYLENIIVKLHTRR